MLQNGANSAVGKCVIAIAASEGINTINIVRDRPNFLQVKNELLQLGANIVLNAEKDIPDLVKEPLAEFQRVKLGLNCVGGTATSDMAKLVPKGSIIVTYGGMSQRPMLVPTGAMIFKDITLRGFWMSRWYEEVASTNDGKPLRDAMMNEICKLFIEKKMTIPFKSTIVSTEQESWNEAIKEATLPSYKDLKQILLFQ